MTGKRKAMIGASIELVVVLGLLWGGYELYRELSDVTTGEDVSSVAWLPTSAQHVSFRRSYSFTAFEFDIPQDDFVRWSDEHGWHAEPTPRPAHLYNWKREPIEIARGLSFAKELANGGGTWVAYDSEKHRAYYESTPR